MPIQNIDNFLMPTRSQEASMQKFNGENKIPAEQQFLTGEVREKAERNLKRTNETEKTDFLENGFDAKKKGSNEYYLKKTKKKKKTDSSEKSERNLMGTEGRTIDIKL